MTIRLVKRWSVFILLACNLFACGGGGNDTSPTYATSSVSTTVSPTTAVTTIYVTTTSTSSSIQPLAWYGAVSTMGEGMDVYGREIYGVISSDAIWEKGVYIINGKVSVPVGVKLIIKPGSVIVGVDEKSRLEIAGTLEAVGTRTDRIRFTAQTSLAKANRKWHGIAFFNSTASRMEYATIEQALNAVELNGYSPVPLKNILFQDNILVFTDQSVSQSIDIQRCTFINNISVFAGIRVLDGLVSGNDFENNQQIFEYGVYENRVIVSNNNFEGAALVVRAPLKGAGTLIFKDNWWGTVDTQTIDRLIFDEKRLGTLQKLDYLPVRQSRLPAGID